MDDEWDRTHDWVVYRTRHDRVDVSFQFAGRRPTAAELAVVRSVVPRYRDAKPADLLAEVVDGQLVIGVIHGREAVALRTAVGGRLGLTCREASFDSFLPFDRTDGCVWLIEDDAEATRVADRMIAAGVPVEVSEE